MSSLCAGSLPLNHWARSPAAAFLEMSHDLFGFSRRSLFLRGSVGLSHRNALLVDIHTPEAALENENKSGGRENKTAWPWRRMVSLEARRYFEEGVEGKAARSGRFLGVRAGTSGHAGVVVGNAWDLCTVEGSVNYNIPKGSWQTGISISTEWLSSKRARQFTDWRDAEILKAKGRCS